MKSNISGPISRMKASLVSLFLLVITVAAYWPVHTYELVNYDDYMYITESPYVTAGLTLDGVAWALTTFDASNWHPLTWLSHMLDTELYGRNPGGRHLTSVVLHAINGLLLFFVLWKITGSLLPSASIAALFVIHPLHVESVAWVSERKDVLSTLFWLLTMWAYVGYSARPNLQRYLLVALALALGLLAKPMLVTLPFVFLLLDFWPLGRLRLASFKDPSEYRMVWKLVWEKLPLFGLVAASTVMTYLAQQAGGTVRSLETFPFWVRAENALVTYVGYIGKMFWPSKLSVFYPHPGSTLPIWQVLGSALLLIAASALVIWARRRRPYLAVGWFWYLGTLVPVIGLLQLGGQAMADRYTYVPLIGLFIMIAWGIPDLVARWSYRRVGLTIAVCIVLLTLVVSTRAHVAHWQNSTTLFEHALRVTTDNHLAHNNLAVALTEQGRIEEAVAHYREALRIRPNFIKAHNNLGHMLTQQGELTEAIALLSRALEYRPGYANAHNNLGLALAQKGDLTGAIAHYTQSIRIRPDNKKAHNNLGLALARQGKLDEAIVHYREALRLKPDYANAHNSLGIALARQGKFGDAIFHLNEALRINPDDANAHNNMGLLLVREGKLAEAIDHYSQALRVSPDNEQIHNNLGIALVEQGKLTEAIAHYSRALEIRPGYQAARNNLNKALLQQGK